MSKDWVDRIPTYAAVDAARPAPHPARMLPRMQEQGPWCGDHAVTVPVLRNTSTPRVDLPIVTIDEAGGRHD